MKMKRNRILRTTQDRNTVIQNVCTTTGFIKKIKVMEYGSHACSVTAGATNNVRKQLKTGDLCAETVLKPGKTYRKRTAHITENSIMAKITFYTLSEVCAKYNSATFICSLWFICMRLFLSCGVRLWVHLVRRPLFGLLYQPRMIHECGAVGEMRIGKGNRSTRRKPVSVPLCPPQIPHDLTWYRTRAAAVEAGH
jgi:hypothetical protein